MGDIRQKGFMVGIEIVLDKKTKTHYPIEKRIGHRISMKAREYKVIVRNLGDVIIFNASTICNHG